VSLAKNVEFRAVSEASSSQRLRILRAQPKRRPGSPLVEVTGFGANPAA